MIGRRPARYQRDHERRHAHRARNPCGTRSDAAGGNTFKREFIVPSQHRSQPGRQCRALSPPSARRIGANIVNDFPNSGDDNAWAIKLNKMTCIARNSVGAA